MFLLEKLRNIKCAHNIVAFIIIVCVAFSYIFLRNIDLNIGDAGWYLTIAEGCVDGKGIHLFIFPQTFRGCLFPIYLQLVKHSIGIRIGWAVTSSFIMAIIFSIIMPSFFDVTEEKRRLMVGLFFVMIYIYIFGDTLAYTLSDVFAVFFLLVGLWMIKMVDVETSQYKETILSFIGGICMYIAYNTRVALLFGILVALFVFLLFGHQKLDRKMLCVIALLIGMAFASIPQCLVNFNCEGVFTPRIYTENYSKIYGSAVNLQMQQIEWGLNYDRYETYVGEVEEEYPTAQVFFYDIISREILERENIKDSITIPMWFGLWLKYPLDMVGVYTRHIISAMTPNFSRLYIYSLNEIQVRLYLYLL